MLRNLIDIEDISVIQQSLNDNIYGVKNVQFNEKSIGAGAVGAVFKIENIDGKSIDGFLLKVISESEFIDKTYETISLLHKKINKRQSQTNTPIFLEFPELRGLPFLVFKAKIQETDEEVTGLLMQNLSENGYVDYGDENWNRQQYFGVEIPDKLYLAYQLARGVDFLHELKFIHSDLKDNSIFLNLKIPQIAIIDFDGGFNYDKQSSALTIGAITSWASSKFRSAIGRGKSSKDFTYAERLDEENWNLAVGIFEVLFGIQPFYFLKDNEDDTMKSYLKGNSWPSIPADLTLMNEQNLTFHNQLLSYIEDVSNGGLQQVVDTFKKIFNAGYKNESKRLSPKQWKDLLFKLNAEFIGAPIIEFFKSKKNTLEFKGDSIEFSWSGKFYRSISLNGIQQEQHSTSFSVPLDDECEVEIKFINDFGETKDSISIKANRIAPSVKKFESSIKKRIDLTPVRLFWETENTKRVTITQLLEELSPNGEIEVNPLEKTTFILTAFGNFDQEITSTLEIDVELAKINLFKYEINIERGIDNVDLFWETENTQEVEISPRIGKVELNGETFIGIVDKTEFTITAKGYFNEVQKTIEAQPFPIPIIKGIFVPTPIVNLENSVPSHLLEIPQSLTNLSNLNLNTSIDFNSVVPNYIDLDTKLPGLSELTNLVPDTSNLFNRIFKKTK
jgi:serine/threonine protein kinase